MVDECENCGLELDDCTCGETAEDTTLHLPEGSNATRHDYRQEEWLMRYHYAQTQHQNDQNH
jgi:hypothetical protein